MAARRARRSKVQRATEALIVYTSPFCAIPWRHHQLRLQLAMPFFPFQTGRSANSTATACRITSKVCFVEVRGGRRRGEGGQLRCHERLSRRALNSWDEVNLTSIEGVCVDESVATSTSSVSRITEPAISHPPQAGSDSKLFLQRENTMPKGCSSEYTTSENLPKSSHNTQSFKSDDF